MLETFCLSVLGSGGVAGIFFALIRHYIERRLMEVEAREQERIKYKIEQRKADEEITHATGRVLFWLHHAIVKGEHNGELEEAFENLQRAEAHKRMCFPSAVISDFEIRGKHRIQMDRHSIVL